MKKISAVFVFFLITGGFLCAQSEVPLTVETETPDVSALSADTVAETSNFHQEGIASWYGAEFAGRATASGEIFDPAQFTAAHADLPFGTYLIVTNSENGKRVAVRVNDRGPFVHSRILDVSRAAAERLDMLAAGTAKVVIESATRESAQSLMRNMGASTAMGTTPVTSSRASAPAPSGAAAAAPSSPQAPASRTSAPPEAASTAAPSSPQAPASRTSAPPEAASTAAAPSSPQAPASRTSAPPEAASTADNAPPSMQAPASRTSAPPETAAAVPPSPQTPTSRANMTDTPVMTPAAPRTPIQPTTVPVPTASVSRVTGNVENIPEIRRPSDPGYIVVDEQALPITAPRTTTPVVAPPAPPSSAPVASRTAPAPAAAQTATPAPVTSPATTPAPASAVPPLAAASRTAASAVTPVSTEPQPAPVQANPAASVPVTGPRPGTEKTEFTGSPIVQGKNYRIQVGSFADLKNASEVFLRLSDAGLNPSYERYDDKYYRVVITNVKAEDADDLSRKLAEIGITEALAREDAGSR